MRAQAAVLRVLLAYSYAREGSAELRLAVRQLRKVLPDAGFVGGPVYDDEALRQRLRISFDNCFEGLFWTMPREAAPLAVTSIEIVVNQSRHTTYPRYGGDYAVAFWFSVASVMQATLHLLAQCEACRHKFVRPRPDAKWCTKACGVRARSRRWYAENRQKAATRKHEAYVERQRQAHGSKVQVAQRPRARRSG